MIQKVNIFLQTLAFVVVGVPLSILAYIFSPTIGNYPNQAVVSNFNVESIDKKQEEVPITILAFGDMMLDRGVRRAIDVNTKSYPFVNIKDFLAGNDIVVVNAEGPFTHFESKTVDYKNKDLIFTFDPKMLPELKSLGFNVLSQANNHSLNFGFKGLTESQMSIESSGIDWFGDPSNKEGIYLSTTTRGQTISFIGYHQFTGGGLSNVIKQIADSKAKNDFVIVYPHWGEEYNKAFTELQQTRAHMFIDAGADVVIGAHPHVIEPIEIYNNKPVFYSLGNFIFDQDFSRDTMEGLSVGISIFKDRVEYALFPIAIKNRQASLIRDDRRWEILQELATSSVVSEQMRNNLTTGLFSIKR